MVVSVRLNRDVGTCTLSSHQFSSPTTSTRQLPQVSFTCVHIHSCPPSPRVYSIVPRCSSEPCKKPNLNKRSPITSVHRRTHIPNDSAHPPPDAQPTIPSALDVLLAKMIVVVNIHINAFVKGGTLAQLYDPNHGLPHSGVHQSKHAK
ncbi:hypothetical protein BV22DRAFT_847987 [Leucogyrophana mollusca]|uniref:Uncharacterized protein n=1 Tax=Leucogyrophana mollusca TaxID=85980 RepID=A0ACB8B1R3_9AGAM|nr:hypothetical protein BV22DRAFT_847987 [Leucogyrophana mollusca]